MSTRNTRLIRCELLLTLSVVLVQAQAPAAETDKSQPPLSATEASPVRFVAPSADKPHDASFVIGFVFKFIQ